MRAKDLVGLPVVTIDSGEHVGWVKDVVLSARSGRLRAFTLERGGLLSKDDRNVLPLSSVRAIEPDAVMIDRAGVLQEPDVDATEADIISTDAVSEAGRRLGTVRDVIVDTDDEAPVIGYEIEADGGGKLLIREDDAVSVSEDALVVAPGAEAVEWSELGGFGSAVQRKADA